MRKRTLSLLAAGLFAASGCKSNMPSEVLTSTTFAETTITTISVQNITEAVTTTVKTTVTTTAGTELTTIVTEETQSPEEYYTELYYTAVPMPKASDCMENFEEIKAENANYEELSENIEVLLRKNAVCCEFFVHGGKFTSVDGDDVIAPDEVFICESELFPDFKSLKDFTNSVYTEECTVYLMDSYKLYDYGNGEIRKIGTGPVWPVNIMSAENLYAITGSGIDYCNFVCFWDSYVPMPDEEIPDDYKQYTVTEHTAVRVNGEWRLSEMVNDLANNRFHLRIDKTPVWTAPNGEVLYLEDAYEVSEGSEGMLMRFDKVFYRPSTGISYNINDNPELFDPETKAYLGEKITYDGSDMVSVKSGDKICGYTVKEAESLVDTGNGAVIAPRWNSITFEDDITLTGTITYYNYDEPTQILTGDIGFSPDSSYKDMPMMRIVPSSGIKEDYSTGIYNDTMYIPLGNYFEDYADNEELKALFGDGTEYMTTEAEVTISGLHLAFADFLGTAWTYGRIKEIRLL